MATTVAEMQARVTANTRDFDRGMDHSEGRMRRGMSTLGKLAIAGGAAVAAGVGAGAVFSIKAASDLGEQINKTSVVFGDNAKDIHNWSRGLTKDFGMSQRAALEAAGTYGNMLKPMGLAPPLVAKMSTSMVELAGDMASFNNASPEDTLDALRAGLAGETEPLRRFGIFLNDARLKQQAMSMGLYDGVGALNANVKAQATFALIMKDSTDAQGDFARTSNSLPNLMRTIRATVENLAARIGAKLLPTVVAAAEKLGELLDFFDKVTSARSPTVGLRIVFEGIKGAVVGLYEKIRDIIFGTTTAKPLKLESGKIFEWDRRSTEGLWDRFVAAVPDALRRVDWRDVGTTIGNSIGDAIVFTAEALSKILTAIADWVDAHVSELAEIGIKIGLAMLDKIDDPKFWRENWQLILSAAIAIFPFARVFNVGARAAAVLGRGFGRATERIFLRLIAFVGKVLDGIPRLLREAFQVAAVYSFISNARDRLVQFGEWVAGNWRKLVLAALSAPFTLAFARVRLILIGIEGVVLTVFNFFGRRVDKVRDKIIAVINKIRDLIDWIQGIPGKVLGPLSKVAGAFGAIGGAVGRAAGAVGDLELPTGPGRSLVGIGRWLQSLGFQVAEHPSFGGVTAGAHTPGSFHYAGRAIDVNWPVASQEPAMLDRIYPLLRALHPLELLWRTKGHFDHLHLAMDRAGWHTLRPGINLVGNYTGRPEPIYATGRGGRGPAATVNFYAPNYLGREETLMDSFRRMVSDYERRNGRSPF